MIEMSCYKTEIYLRELAVVTFVGALNISMCAWNRGLYDKNKCKVLEIVHACQLYMVYMINAVAI